MALADILTTDGDLTDVKTALTRTLRILSEAAMEYAKASLASASAVLEVAMAGGPCAAAYTNFTDTRRFDGLARTALESAADVASLLMTVNETPDEDAANAYGTHLAGITNTDIVSALLEGANSRMQMAYRALPKNPQPAALFNATIFTAQDGAKET